MRRDLWRPRWAPPVLAAVLVVALISAASTLTSLGGLDSRASAGQPSGAGCAPQWVTAWHASPIPVAGPGAAHGVLGGRTLRLIIRPQLDGSQLRLRLSNRYGRTPLRVGTVTAGKAGDGAALDGLAVPVNFGGRSSTAIPPRSELLSDPVRLAVSRGQRLAVSIFLPNQPTVLTEHPTALQTSYLSRPGDHAATPDGTAFDRQLTAWPVLIGAQVTGDRKANAVVVLGDSITDGIGSRTDANARWTDQLATRLVEAGGERRMPVLNAGISGNRLLVDNEVDGESPRSRFPWELAGQPGITDVILHTGTNDIGAGRSAPDIIASMIDFAAQAKAAGMRVFLTTITPSRTGPHGTATAALMRHTVNEWIRALGHRHSDGVFDLARAVEDQASPAQLGRAFDAGDGLHLSAEGYQALAGAVDIGQLSGSPCLASSTG